MAVYHLFPLIIITVLSFLSNADPRIGVIARLCDKMQVQNLSNYFKYYAMVTDYMEGQMLGNKFAFKEEGKPPDRLYALAQCMEDLTYDECAYCYTQIITFITGCFPRTGGRIFFDGCFIRVANYSFYQETVGPQDIKRCSDVINEGQEFGNAVKKVLDKLVQEAPISRGFATKHESSNGITVYGMSVCWKTLDAQSCSTCLSAAALSAMSCLPASEARVLNAGCYLRYSNFLFANDPNSPARGQIISYITYVLGFAAICLVAIAIGFSVGKFTYKRKNRINTSGGTGVDLLLEDRLHFLQFKHATLKIATENFSEDHRLGRGGFGEVYKGTLRDGREIAIKRLFVSGKSQMREICNEMDIISRAQHKNLVRFLGCCFTSMDSLLVYEYLANKSLDLTLFDPVKKKELDWKKRILIIIGTAEGLEYLHKDCQVRIIHRDIKASNVLLDVRYKPKIADFGLARFHSCDQSLVNTAIAGTLGYMAPEYIAKGRLTEKVDVYSFGVLVIEIVTGVENNKYHSEDAYETLITYAWKHFQTKTISEIIDESMEVKEDVEEIKRIIQIGLLCTQESPLLRPSMTEVVQMLRRRDFKLPTPSKPPFTDELMELHHLGSDR